MVEINNTNIEGCYYTDYFSHVDDRGTFDKFYIKKTLNNFDVKESALSVNLKKNTIRGIHYCEDNEYSQNKIILCISGSLLDVVIDLRKESKTFKNIFYKTFNFNDKKLIHIPKGCGHAFLTLEDNTSLIYLMDGYYNDNKEKGILWNSIDFSWDIKKPIISLKDSKFPKYIDKFNL